MNDNDIMRQTFDDMLATLQAQRDSANNQVVQTEAALKAKIRELDKAKARIEELEKAADVADDPQRSLPLAASDIRPASNGHDAAPMI